MAFIDMTYNIHFVNNLLEATTLYVVLEHNYSRSWRAVIMVLGSYDHGPGEL
jgi:hypothetical protein